MFDFLNSSIATELQESGKKTVTPNLSGDKLEYTVTGPNTRKCKIDIDCDNMKIIISDLNQFITSTESKYNSAVTAAIKSINDKSGEKLKNGNDLATLFVEIEKIKTTLINEQKARDKLRSVGTKTVSNIKCTVNVKDKDPVQGTIAKIRIYNDENIIKKGSKYRALVDVTYPDPNTKKIETITDVDVEKLCLNTPCDIPTTAAVKEQKGGKKISLKGGKAQNESSDFEKAIIICE